MKIKNGRKVKIVLSKKNSVQEWLPIDKIFENGIVKLKNNNYLKIIKVTPINFNLKSELEKEAILNSYKIFLKTCNFDLQILIQSNKEDLSEHISCVKNSTNNENNTIKEISDLYIKFLNDLNNSRKSAVKNYYILIKKQQKNIDINKIENFEEIIFEELNDDFFKIKETLSRCGNIVVDINNEKLCKNILFSFFYPKK